MGSLLHYLGLLLLLEGLAMAATLPCTIVYPTLTPYSMPLSAMLTSASGFVLYAVSRKARRDGMEIRDVSLLLTLSWSLTSMFGALPYLLSGVLPSFIDAFFESVSGFTATGASVIRDLDTIPRDVLLWRSTTQWLGGIGIVVLAIVVLPYMGTTGHQFMMTDINCIAFEKLSPKIVRATRKLWLLYMAFTILLVVLLTLGDMTLYEAINHAMTTVSSGGFSTNNGNIGDYSIYTQSIILAFMFISGLNLLTLFLSIRSRSNMFKDQEFKYYRFITLVSSVVVFIGLILTHTIEPLSAVREALFSVVSILTTTGFFVSDYSLWPTFLWTMLFVLMFIGASAGSTTGGVKLIRYYLLSSNTMKEQERILHPNALLPVKINDKNVSDEIVNKAMVFMLLYVVIFIIGSIVLLLQGYDFQTSFGASVACLGNIGPGIGAVGPFHTYHFMTPLAKGVLVFEMLAGRLELFAVLVLFSRHFWHR